jgi:hypothetical protein
VDRRIHSNQKFPQVKRDPAEAQNHTYLSLASKTEGSISSVREYARFLLNTSPSPDGDDPDVDAARERETGGLTGCREAVEILTRNPRKCKPSGDISFGRESDE